MPTTSAIYNSLSSKDLDAVELVEPGRIEFYASSLANQINTFRMGYTPQKRVIDLSKWISDITIETTAQGGSLLSVSVIDPAWTMFIRDANGVSFIDVDDSGYLWPPVEVTFPPDTSDATWRLCQCIPTSDLTAANVTLTFEDKIVSELREHFGAQVSYPNQTRAEFMQSLIKQANADPEYPGEVDIRFVPLLPKSTFTVADLTMQERLPKSATQPNPPRARKNPNKNPNNPGPKNTTGTPFQNPFAPVAPGVDISIEDGIDTFTNPQQLAGYVPPSPAPPSKPVTIGGGPNSGSLGSGPGGF